MQNFKKKLLGRALLSVTLTAAMLLISLQGRALAVHYGDPLTSPDTTIPVTDSGLNGWSNDGYVDWASDNTNPGIKGGFGNLTGNATAGYWHHNAVYPSAPGDFSDNNYFELVYDGPEIQGKLVSDWHGLEYRNYQLTVQEELTRSFCSSLMKMAIWVPQVISLTFAFSPKCWLVLQILTMCGTPMAWWDEIHDLSTRSIPEAVLPTVNSKASTT